MQKPKALTELIEELENECISGEVATTKTSKVILYLEEDAVDIEDGVTLTDQECKLLFANTDTVERLIECLDDAGSASLCLFDITLSSDVLDAVERGFAAVDES